MKRNISVLILKFFMMAAILMLTFGSCDPHDDCDDECDHSKHAITINK